MQRDIATLKYMFKYIDNQMLVDDYNNMVNYWDQSWPLLRLIISEQVKIEGLTDFAWREMAGFYEFLVETGMKDVQCGYCQNSERLSHEVCSLLHGESI